MKQLLSIGLLGALFTTSNQLEAKNYKVEKIGTETNEMTINPGDTFSYEKQTRPYNTGAIIKVETSSSYYTQEETTKDDKKTYYVLRPKKDQNTSRFENKPLKMTIRRYKKPTQIIELRFSKNKK